MDNMLQLFKEMELFKNISSEDFYTIRSYIKQQEYDKNVTLFNAGDCGDMLYIVSSGSVTSFSILPNGIHQNIASFTQGDFFGEMAIFEDAPRSATCVTLEPTQLFTLSKNNFFNMIDLYPSISFNIMNNMLRIITMRLKNRSIFLSDLVKWGERARRRAIIDDVTGIYNRRYLDNSLDQLIEKARDQQASLSMVMIDIDNFREIVDKFPLNTVNKIICEMIEIFKKYLLKNDIFARFGGDEFSLLLPQTDARLAYERISAICNEVANHMFSISNDQTTIHISISMGIASFPENAEQSTILQQCADEALYRAKKEGKNRVVVY